MAGFAEVRFKGTRKAYFSYAGIDVRPGQHVIVQADRGEDLGEVSAVGVIAERKCSSSSGGCATPAPEQEVVRLAREDELQLWSSLRADEDRVRVETRKLVTTHGLKMKVTEAEWLKRMAVAAKKRNKPFSKSLAQERFSKLDANQNGVIDQTELAK